jgi:UDP-GlcNAc:undecaprenyl-phosphate GlcNAc-1-phosphate transferase
MLSILAAAAFGITMLLSLLGTHLMRRLSGPWGLVARPGGHRGHARPTPAGGGVAIVGSIVLCLGGVLAIGAVLNASFGETPPSWLPGNIVNHLAGEHSVLSRAPTLGGLLAGALALHVLGLLDDRRPLPFLLRLGVQGVVAAAVVVLCGVRLTLFIPPAWGWVGGLLSVVWIVLITNAFNFMDNMDGLSAGVGGICCLVLAGVCFNVGQLFVPGTLLVVAGALAGFLVFNFPPAKIFMGDSGSTVVGFLIGSLSLLGTYHSEDAGAPSRFAVFIPVVVLAVPLYDVLTVIVLRLREGRSPFLGDRRHFSHRLCQRGLSVRNAVLTIYLITFITAITATSLTHANVFAAVLSLTQVLAILTVLAVLEHPFVGPSPDREAQNPESTSGAAGTPGRETGEEVEGAET